MKKYISLPKDIDEKRQNLAYELYGLPYPTAEGMDKPRTQAGNIAVTAGMAIGMVLAQADEKVFGVHEAINEGLKLGIRLGLSECCQCDDCKAKRRSQKVKMN